MNIKDIVEKIKLFLASEEDKVSLTDVKTTDGLILSFDGELATGIEIFVTDENGRTPAPDGEYILEDGTKIIVADGMIGEIVAPAEPVETPAEIPVEEMSEEPEKVEPSMAELVEKIAKLEKEYLEIREILTQLAESFSEKILEDEVKMNAIEEEKVEFKITERPLNKTNSNLERIFYNMYNKKL